MPRVAQHRRVPWNKDAVESGDKKALSGYFRELVLFLKNFRDEVVQAVNTQTYAGFVAQDDQPTPETNQIICWEDTDAGPAMPTHYLVYKDPNGVVRTFASVETTGGV